LCDLLQHWKLRQPHLVVHDYGGAVALRAHLLHGARYRSLALVDVVALAPWGSEFFRLVAANTPVFAQIPSPLHEALLRAYITGAAHRPLAGEHLDMLAAPWLGAEGQAAFYCQIAQASQRYTDEIEPLYPAIKVPVLIAWAPRTPGSQSTVPTAWQNRFPTRSCISFPTLATSSNSMPPNISPPCCKDG
ncbi:MAG TPA: alpha/beta hydrolase, partial [Streptosporangiaceae bacterium]|nr:alpha/beta hydrolase [Streptosporangiaceae bacterium]